MKRSASLVLLVASVVWFASAPAVWCADGLKVTIQSVVIDSDLKPEVTFTLEDNEGSPVEVGTASGQASVRFILAHLDVLNKDTGSAAYWSYTANMVTSPTDSPNPSVTAEQATYDSGGITTQLAPGKYVYVFKKALPADYDATETHTVGGQCQRVSNDITYYANPLYHFVPDGTPVVTLRKVVTTESCNKCHTSMGFHGGGRKDVGLCILCHNPHSTDPDTGNSVDMTTMIHKIHMGAELPSVEAGTPYEIIGHGQSVTDFSHVEFPTDHRNCQICHDGPQGDIYKKAPSRRACGSCHDNVNFQTGVGHGPGIPQPDDTLCALCHQPSGDEFGTSIEGAHTVPYKSKKLKGLNAKILEVANATPGKTPTVRFTLTENDGTVVNLTLMRTVAITFGGPTQEYTSYVREDGTKTLTTDGDTFQYTFTKPIPDDAQGTYSFSIEARRDVVLVDNPEGETDISVTESAVNPLYFTAVTGTLISQRRQLVDQNKCNSCHDQLSLHGGLRNNVQYCSVCHNSKESDISRRGDGVGGGSSISFGYMIHKIHTGEELNQPYVVYGYGNTANDFSEVLFPGMRQQCTICHTDQPQLPLPDAVQAINFTNKDGNVVHIPPTTAACTSCHTSDEALTHVSQFNQVTELCATCHGPGQFKDIALNHKLNIALDVTETSSTPSTVVPDWYYHK